MTTVEALTYSQRFEDLYLASCFPGRTNGFYIDIGAGHPVYDNVTFYFYTRGWRGITVEPNPRLAKLSRAIRPRDIAFDGVAGEREGEATFHLVEDYHGLSTTIAAHAQSAQSEFGKASKARSVPMTTLKALCERHAPGQIDLLKIDVEGAEREVIAGGDWARFRPKVVIAEALAPFTLAPAWDAWEPMLTAQGYRYVRFDTLNRYYVHESEPEMIRRLADAPEHFSGAVPFRDFKPALDDQTHPDRKLALLLKQPDMAELPLTDPRILIDRLAASLPAHDLAAATDAARDLPGMAQELLQSKDVRTARDLYARIVDSDPFRAALGRISASSAW